MNPADATALSTSHLLAPGPRTACSLPWLEVEMALRYALTFPWTPEAGREARQRISWLRAEAQHLAARIAASGPPATRGAKRIVTTRLLAGFGEARALPDTIRHAIEWSHDIDEGSAAHREGRPPRFTGR